MTDRFYIKLHRHASSMVSVTANAINNLMTAQHKALKIANPEDIEDVASHIKMIGELLVKDAERFLVYHKELSEEFYGKGEEPPKEEKKEEPKTIHIHLPPTYEPISTPYTPPNTDGPYWTTTPTCACEGGEE